jgi:hypothetical protein
MRHRQRLGSIQITIDDLPPSLKSLDNYFEQVPRPIRELNQEARVSLTQVIDAVERSDLEPRFKRDMALDLRMEGDYPLVTPVPLTQLAPYQRGRPDGYQDIISQLSLYVEDRDRAQRREIQHLLGQFNMSQQDLDRYMQKVQELCLQATASHARKIIDAGTIMGQLRQRVREYFQQPQ